VVLQPLTRGSRRKQRRLSLKNSRNPADGNLLARKENNV
jgi:hypothetical protein